LIAQQTASFLCENCEAIYQTQDCGESGRDDYTAYRSFNLESKVGWLAIVKTKKILF